MLKLCVLPQFSMSDEGMKKGCSDHVPTPEKKEEILKRRRLFEEQPSAAAILSTFLSRLSHQASSAAILCSRPQAISHLAVVSGWWAAVSQPLNINLRWSWAGGRLFLNYWTSTSCRQLLVVIHERVPWKKPLTAFSGKKGECPEPKAVVSTSWVKIWKPSCSC